MYGDIMTTSSLGLAIFKVFDKTFPESTHIYLVKEDDATKQFEVINNCNKIRQTFAADNLLILDEVHGVAVVDADTYSNPDKYFSYRRDMQQGINGNKTNILSAIMLKSDVI